MQDNIKNNIDDIRKKITAAAAVRAAAVEQTTKATEQTMTPTGQSTKATGQTTKATGQTTKATGQTTKATEQTTKATERTMTPTEQTTKATEQTATASPPPATLHNASPSASPPPATLHNASPSASLPPATLHNISPSASPPPATLIAVSKNHGLDAVQAAMDCGINHFGENKLQEAMTKFTDDDVRKNITLHFIGHLQSNKVKQAVHFFDYIHSLDRPSVATALANEKKNWQGEKKFPKLLIEVNLGEEPQKSGVMPQDLNQFFSHCHELGLGDDIVGLMAILPIARPPAPFFAFLKQRADELQLPETSMGMSSDYEEAIELGATMVRIGTGIFGGR